MVWYIILVCRHITNTLNLHQCDSSSWIFLYILTYIWFSLQSLLKIIFFVIKKNEKYCHNVYLVILKLHLEEKYYNFPGIIIKNKNLW
jgi:hypothetical protein